jgi:penicillin amidase
VLAQFESFGPAVRLVVSPGHEADAILTMPAGEAGNPLAPYYRRGHQEWQKGLPLPLLSGEPRYVLQLQPPSH